MTNLVAPSFMKMSAKRGLELHAEGKSGDGLKPATVGDATKMVEGTALSEDKWRRIAPWIARHISDLDAVQGDEITAGLVAMLLWGGGSSKSSARRTEAYAERIVAQLDAAEERAPAPKKDQIKGSDKNPAGSAKDKTGGIEVSEETETALRNKLEEHNEKMKDRPAWTRTTFGALKAVYRRGAGAYSGSHRPGIGRQQWSMARVNAFLHLCRVGRPKNPKYITDYDLLHKSHPKYSGKRGDAEQSPSAIVDDMAHTETPYTEVPEQEEEPEVVHAGWVTSGNEARSIAYTNLELRADEDGNTLVGYAAVFDSPSEPMPYTEFVRRGAFAKTLNDGADVRLLIDHDGVPLARTRSGTMSLEEDERGLRVEAELDPANPDAARVLSAMRRGDLSQMSFAFKTIKDSYNEDRSVRELKEVKLFDVSIVTFPAYEDTVAELRTRNETATVTVASNILIRKNQVLIAKHKQP